MKHSMKEAVVIQKAFEDHFCSEQGVKGSVGICLDSRTGELALNVQLSRKEDAIKLPKKFNGLSVIVDIVGDVRAL